MKILGIETSCDETAAAVVEDGRKVLSNIVVSSLKEHAKYGGVIPEIASRRQLECIQPVVQEALAQAHLGLDDLDAVAVTQSPGLIGSLLVGISFAQTLAMTLRLPCVAIDHIKAHLYANFLSFPKEDLKHPRLPAIGLVVSGGHTNLYYVPDPVHIRLIGATRDDAVGEAFDKVARICGLGYPGGPAIDRLAKTAKGSSLRFSGAELPDSLDFSFSGIKTAVLYHHRDHKADPNFSVQELVRAFQDSVVTSLVNKCLQALRKHKVQTLLVGGGVAANSQLREALTKAAGACGTTVHFPPMSLCLDNAAMIAGLAYHERRAKKPSKKA